MDPNFHDNAVPLIRPGGESEGPDDAGIVDQRPWLSDQSGSGIASEPESVSSTRQNRWSRRQWLQVLAAAGITHEVFLRALAAQAENGAVTAEMIRQAEWIAGITLSEEQRAAAARALNRLERQWADLRQQSLPYTVSPVLAFFPDGCESFLGPPAPLEVITPRVARPESADALAFLTVAELSHLLRAREISSQELTRLYVDRLRRADPVLRCVVTFTEELAYQQARRADEELARGQWRGPLHGIPWGAKDLISVPGYPTSWGATPFAEQQLAETATVAERLEAAGAVLIAKLTLGALAQGDRWFGGMTRNPWNPQEGSSGSSAGSAAATAAGLVGFAIGSETLGSIVSPCRRCGVTGLRPTFGRVSRYGCMPLAWTMDKLGPIARSAEDCALVLAAIHGRDAKDPASVDRPFQWPPPSRRLRIGYFEDSASPATLQFLEFLKSESSVELRPITLPHDVPADSLVFILNVEAATAFDQITRQGITDGLNEWPGAFHQGQLTPAVEYLRAQRLRQLLIQRMKQLFQEVDAYVGGNDLVITNLTGHPTVVFPAAIAERNGKPQPICATVTGNYFDEEQILLLVHRFQQVTDYHRRQPLLEG